MDNAHQPQYSNYARIRKCCPWGQNYERSDRGTSHCVQENVAFHVTLIEAIFYQFCIEDTENEISLNYEFGNACSEKHIAGSSLGTVDKENAFIYSKKLGDLLYVLQNGSLLRVDFNYTGYDIFNNYCLDMDRNDRTLTAIVCGNEGNDGRIFKGETYVYTTCKFLFNTATS